MQDFGSENSKRVVREILKDLINGEIFHVYGLEDNIAKTSMFPKLFYRISFNCNPSKLFCRSWQVTPKIHVEIQSN